jgi:hypothetical protein
VYSSVTESPVAIVIHERRETRGKAIASRDCRDDVGELGLGSLAVNRAN